MEAKGSVNVCVGNSDKTEELVDQSCSDGSGEGMKRTMRVTTSALSEENCKSAVVTIVTDYYHVN